MSKTKIECETCGTEHDAETPCPMCAQDAEDRHTKWLALKITSCSDEYWGVGGFIVPVTPTRLADFLAMRAKFVDFLNGVHASSATCRAHFVLADQIMPFGSFQEDDAFFEDANADGEEQHRVFETGEPNHKRADTDCHQYVIFADGDVYVRAWGKHTTDYAEAKFPDEFLQPVGAA